jgi:predicted nucleotidyltransferase
METLPKTNTYSFVAKGIMKVLLYSDVFHYPLTLEEIKQRHPLKNITNEEVQKELFELLEKKAIFQIGEFYTLQNKPENVDKRVKANVLAQKYLEKSKRIVSILKHFPFVKAIFLSGSISKNYIDENSDIDYFVITKAGYLWIVRSLFVLFRRIGLLGSKKLFCFNYMIDEEHLKTSHESIYIATEIATLIPMYQDGIQEAFLQENIWMRAYYPNFPIQILSKKPKSWLKILGEFFLQP